jgi:penicillin-binding protein 1A
LVASAQVQPTSDILLDLYGDDPADAELEGSVPMPEPGAELDPIQPGPPGEPAQPGQPSEPVLPVIEPSAPEPAPDDELPSILLPP